ncbi:Nn.00g101390.m01.CDS01 [Neocucurbitaria sp. VM-36]
MASELFLKCSTCGELTTKKCSGCKTHNYCGRDCQVEDWPTHKVYCKDIQLEKTLARVAEILQAAYFTFRENTWNMPIDKIVEKEDELEIYPGDQKKNTNHFTEFPGHLIKNKAARISVLTVWMSQEPMAFMHDLLVQLLHGLQPVHLYLGKMLTLLLLLGLHVKVEEVGVALKTVVRKTTAIWPNGRRFSNWPGYPHHVLRMTSSQTGRQWLVDFSGAQFGIYQAMWKWEDYQESYIQEILARYPSSTLKALIGKVAKIPGNPSFHYQLPSEAAVELDKSIMTWKTQHMDLSKLVTLEGEHFKTKMQDLLKTMEHAVHSFVGNNNFSARVRIQKAYEAAHPGVSSRETQALSSWLSSFDLQCNDPLVYVTSPDDVEFLENLHPGLMVFNLDG